MPYRYFAVKADAKVKPARAVSFDRFVVLLMRAKGITREEVHLQANAAKVLGSEVLVGEEMLRIK